MASPRRSRKRKSAAKALPHGAFQQVLWSCSCLAVSEVNLSQGKAIPTVSKNCLAFVLNGLRTAYQML